MQNITIIGLGKLGLPLAQHLSSQYAVKGTLTQLRPIPDSIKCFEYKLGEDLPKELESPIMILTVPPTHINLKDLFKFKCQRLIYTSSTSVYGDQQGQVDESTLPLPDEENGKKLLEIESWIKTHPEWIILRLGGLIGENRHPGKYLAGRKNLTRGEAPVNLIHHDDVINAILEILKRDLRNEIFNIVSDEHRSRKEFYEQYARIHSLPLPDFLTEEKKLSHKIVMNDKIKRELGIKNFISLI